MKRQIQLTMHNSGEVTNRTPEQKLFQHENQATEIVAYFESECFLEECGMETCDCFDKYKFRVVFQPPDGARKILHIDEGKTAETGQKTIAFQITKDLLTKAGFLEMIIAAICEEEKITMKWEPISFKVHACDKK